MTEKDNATHLRVVEVLRRVTGLIFLSTWLLLAFSWVATVRDDHGWVLYTILAVGLALFAPDVWRAVRKNGLK